MCAFILTESHGWYSICCLDKSYFVWYFFSKCRGGGRVFFTKEKKRPKKYFISKNFVSWRRLILIVFNLNIINKILRSYYVLHWPIAGICYRKSCRPGTFQVRLVMQKKFCGPAIFDTETRPKSHGSTIFKCESWKAEFIDI